MRRSIVARIWGEGGLRLLLGDAAVLALLAGAVATLAIPRGYRRAPRAAQVQASGGFVATLDLTRGAVSEVAGPLGVTRLEVRDGRVRVLSSPCPRQECRRRGWIGGTGEMIVCLPNEVVVRLPGARRGAPDAVAQ